jgi:hypothetical protein
MTLPPTYKDMAEFCRSEADEQTNAGPLGMPTLRREGYPNLYLMGAEEMRDLARKFDEMDAKANAALKRSLSQIKEGN